MNRLKELREEIGLTLRELEQYVDIAFTSLQLLEKGDKPFREEHLEKLSLFFSVSRDYILGAKDFYITVRYDDDPTLDTYIHKSSYDNILQNYKVKIKLIDCNFEIKIKSINNNESYYSLSKCVLREVEGISKKMIDTYKIEITNKLNHMDIDKLKKLSKFIDDFLN